MGQVFRGEDKRLGRPVAVKVLSRDQASDPDAARRFLNEAKSAARLNHPNIAQVYSAGETEDHPYIVFEYVQGVNLRSMIEEQGPLSLVEALSYTLQIADALAHAADRRIVHRDVKPSNVLIAPNGQAKLIDLGLARLSAPNDSDGDLTASGVTLGTFDYISPEQARDPRNADSRSDIYSLGCTLFYMLAGRPPFPEGTVLQKLLQHQGDEPPDICQFRPDLPDEVGQVLSKMMAKDPRRRYPDSARLMEALVMLADLAGLQPTGPAQAMWLPPQESRISTLHRQTPWLAPSMSLFFLVLALHLLWSSQDDSLDMQGFGRLARQDEASQSAAPDNQTASSAARPSPTEGSPNQANTQTLPESGSATTPRVASDPLGSPASTPHSLLRDSWLSRPGSHQLTGPPLAGSLSTDLQAGMRTELLASSVAGEMLAPSEPSEPPLPSDLVARVSQPIPLIVTPTPQSSNQYKSLAVALAANPNATLIEIRYDGNVTEHPFAISGRDVTIRAGTDYHPEITFLPTGTDPVLYPRDMIRISNGLLVLEGIEIELNIPKNMPSESWSLFRLSAEGRIRLKSWCSLRVRNASSTLDTSHKDVAFFRTASQEAGGPFTEPVRTSGEPEIDLRDCIACGEAALVRAPESAPFGMTWNNGFLATTEPVFSIGGSSHQIPAEAQTRIEWTNVTAICGDSLVRLTLAPHRPHSARIDFSGSSACAISSGKRPLIHISDAGQIAKAVKEGANLRTKLQDRFHWTSSSSMYHESSTPLEITDVPDSEACDEEILDGLDLTPSLTRLTSRIAENDRPINSISPTDFEVKLPEPADSEATPTAGFLPPQAPDSQNTAFLND